MSLERWWHRVRLLWISLVRGSALDRQTKDELDFHVDELTMPTGHVV